MRVGLISGFAALVFMLTAAIDPAWWWSALAYVAWCVALGAHAVTRSRLVAAEANANASAAALAGLLDLQRGPSTRVVLRSHRDRVRRRRPPAGRSRRKRRARRLARALAEPE